ncbi:FkbM family methyltransferase [Halomarina rubra]|uniref:FkbM family methyltransferase n=1 Tax=Halomarina rubra TaxID=2071873 RepID=A0ABD6AYC9_9EURY|nr:FkbM family methyltransferase [Halomarina rubra]
MSTMQSVWGISQRLGLAPALSGVYWRVKLAASWWRYRTCVCDVEATFKTTTKSEYLRASTLLGETALVEAFVTELEPADVVWDIGACVGTYACLAATVVTEGHVVAFEPEPTNALRLEENLAGNSPSHRWTVLPVALAERDQSAKLERGVVEPGSGHHFLSPLDEGLPIRARRGESLVANGTPAPTVLKIDVQGAELDVLRGLGTTLDTVQRIYAELHVEKTARYGTSADEVEEFLIEQGFTIMHLGEPTYNRNGVYHVAATR